MYVTGPMELWGLLESIRTLESEATHIFQPTVLTFSLIGKDLWYYVVISGPGRKLRGKILLGLVCQISMILTFPPLFRPSPPCFSWPPASSLHS